MNGASEKGGKTFQRGKQRKLRRRGHQAVNGGVPKSKKERNGKPLPAASGVAGGATGRWAATPGRRPPYSILMQGVGGHWPEF